MALPAEYEQLTREAWRKTNEFDLQRTFNEVTFERSGRLLASYRAGECQHGGTFGLDKGALSLWPDTNACDIRSPVPKGVGASSDNLVFLDDLLVQYASSFRPASSASTRRVFIFDPYFDSLRVRGEFDGALAESVMTPVSVSFENLREIPRQLSKLEISMQRLVLAASGDEYETDGEKVILATRDYAGLRIAPFGKHADELELTPPLSGQVILMDVSIAYSDEQQPYDGSRFYLVTIP